MRQARFSWDAVPDSAVSGYKVHWGTTSGVYTRTVDAGNTTATVIAEFYEGVGYFFVITAYGNTGVESDYSVEVAFTIPPAGGSATPVITVQPSATAITYGQTLASSSLNGGVASVPGAFAFTAPALVPAAGTASQTVTFTPSDMKIYQPVTGSANVTVSKATPSITVPPMASAISYGQTLASSSLSGGVASVSGSFAFTTSGTAPVAGGTLRLARFSWDAVVDPMVSGYKVHWGTQSGVYDHSYDAGNVTEVIISGFAEGIQYFSTITAYSNTGEESDYSVQIAFIIPDTGGTTTLPVGMSSQSVTFTPTDTNNYQTAATTVSVMVKAAKFRAIAQESLESWRVRCFSAEQIATGQAADDADPDRDGLVNLAEYALGTDPLAFTPPMIAVVGSDGLVLTFERPGGLTDVQYAAESADDLIHWNPCLLELMVDGPVQTMRAVDPLTSGDPTRRFISLRFTKP
ncbi:MAG: hypothetical protein WCP45_09985 [Verrucomicrobiota bacterium]